MLDQINAQLKSGRAMSQGRNWSVMQRGQPHALMGDLYPWGADYYHELNPYFLINIPRLDLYDFSKIITVRDGELPFALCMLANFTSLQNFEVGFLVHPSLAKIVPPTLIDRCMTWSISHKKTMPLTEAKSVLITGVMNDDCITLDSIREKIELLHQAPKDAKFEVFLPIRKSPLDPNWKEVYTGYEVLSLIKEIIPDRKLSFLTARELTERPFFNGTYLMDLFDSTELIADRGLWHFIANRGGSIHGWSSEVPTNSMLDLEIGFTHSLHVCPLPAVQSLFTELIFHRRLYSTLPPLQDPGIRAILRGQ